MNCNTMVSPLCTCCTSCRHWNSDQVCGAIDVLQSQHFSVLSPPMRCLQLCPSVGDGALGQGVFQTHCVLKSVLWALGQATENDAFEIGRNVDLKHRRRHQFVACVRDHHLHSTLSAKGRVAGEQTVGDSAKRVDITASIKIGEAAR